MNRRLVVAFHIIYGSLLLSVPPTRADDLMDALLASYPDQLAGYDGQSLIWKDGTRLPVSDGRAHETFEDLLNHPSIIDQFSIPYRLGRPGAPPAVNDDPGRIRNESFFLKMYGDCRKPGVAARMRPVAWLPRRGGGTVMATTINGIADKLEKISEELERLPASSLKYVAPSSGAFNCRTIAGSNRVSMHAYGAAIDINARFGDYWRWSMKDSKFVWHNQIPYEIVEIFERHGFLWGGKWYHFDTLHFEYRPEMISLARSKWSR